MKHQKKYPLEYNVNLLREKPFDSIYPNANTSTCPMIDSFLAISCSKLAKLEKIVEILQRNNYLTPLTPSPLHARVFFETYENPTLNSICSDKYCSQLFSP